MPIVHLGLVQMISKLDDLAANVDKAVRMTRECAKDGADVIQLPELFASEYFAVAPEDRRAYRYAQPRTGEILSTFRALARELGVYLVVPWFEEDMPGIYYNAAALVGPRGELLGVHRKAHIPAAEKLYFRAGERLDVFTTDFGIVGLLICYERSLPEPARVLTLKGAEIIFVCAATGRSGMWSEECRVRAMENGVVVSVCNKTGDEPAGSLCGMSMVVDPTGKILRRLAREEATLLATVDTDDVRAARIDYPVLSDRQPGLYADLGPPAC
jgi:N-carbamoylputrescine amidase